MRLLARVATVSCVLACTTPSLMTAQSIDRPPVPLSVSRVDAPPSAAATRATDTTTNAVRQVDPRVAAHYPVASKSQALTAAAAEHAGLGHAAALMVVGLGGLLAGAIIGGQAGTIIMVGGAIVGLVGLYEYLQ